MARPMTGRLTSRVMRSRRGPSRRSTSSSTRSGSRRAMRVLDVGCGPGRHSLALARRGYEVVGVDHSAEFVRLAREAAGGRRPRRRRSRSSTSASSTARASSTPPSASARAASACSAGATRPTCSAGSPRPLRPGGSLAVERLLRRVRRPPPRGRRGLRPGHRRAPRGGHRARARRRRGAVRPVDHLLHRRASSSCSPRGAGLDAVEVHGVTPGRVRAPAADARPPRAPAPARNRLRTRRISANCGSTCSLCVRPHSRGPPPAPAGQPATREVRIIKEFEVAGSGRDGGDHRHRPRGERRGLRGQPGSHRRPRSSKSRPRRTRPS